MGVFLLFFLLLWTHITFISWYSDLFCHTGTGCTDNSAILVSTVFFYRKHQNNEYCRNLYFFPSVSLKYDITTIGYKSLSANIKRLTIFLFSSNKNAFLWQKWEFFKRTDRLHVAGRRNGDVTVHFSEILWYVLLTFFF